MNAPFDQSGKQCLEMQALSSRSPRLMTALRGATAGSVVIIAGFYAARSVLPADPAPVIVSGPCFDDSMVQTTAFLEGLRLASEVWAAAERDHPELIRQPAVITLIKAKQTAGQ